MKKNKKIQIRPHLDIDTVIILESLQVKRKIPLGDLIKTLLHESPTFLEAYQAYIKIKENGFVAGE